MTTDNQLQTQDSISVFSEINYFNKKMYQYFESGKLSNDFDPFFNWKKGKADISSISQECGWTMRDKAKELLDYYYDKHPEAFSNVELYHYDPDNYDIEESLWCQYKGFKEDMYVVSYLEAIDEELSELIASGLLQA